MSQKSVSEILSRETKEFFKGMVQALPEIKNMVIAPIALGFAFGEKLILDALERPEKSRKHQEAIYKEQKASEEATKSYQIIQQLKAQEGLKVAEELRAEARARRLRKEQQQLTPRKIIHTCLATISTISLLIGVQRLGPIAKWSINLNKCIEAISLNDEYKDLDAADRFIKCNKVSNI